jgi:hypothetical protein
LKAELPAGYARLVGDIKARIRRARLAAAAAVNQELLLLYHSIGSDLDRRMEEEAWGSGIIDRVSADLRAAFPEMDGLSPRKLRRMRAFYRAYPRAAAASRKLPPAVAAFRDMAKPIGVAEWETQIVEKLPEELKGSLPTVEEIEAELGARGRP